MTMPQLILAEASAADVNAVDISTVDIGPSVKNTFIDFRRPKEGSMSRRKSVPASSRLARTNTADSEASTFDGHTTDSSDGSGSGIRTPLSTDDFSPSEEAGSDEVCCYNYWCQPPPQPWTSTEGVGGVPFVRQRLNAKASAFQPVEAVQSFTEPVEAPGYTLEQMPIFTEPDEAAGYDLPEPPLPVSETVNAEPYKVAHPEAGNQKNYKRYFSEVIEVAKKRLLSCNHVSNVEIGEDENGGFSIIVQCRSEGQDELQTGELLELAQESLLHACSVSRCIYIMGYFAGQPFTSKPQGFQFTMGAMESHKTACWHVFKKGFCRHGADGCVKQHPAGEMSVQVLIEHAQFNTDLRYVSAFKEEVANTTMAVIASLGDCSFVEAVDAVKNKDSQGWSIEMKVNGNKDDHRDYVLSLAKHALFQATSTSNFVWIMGYAAKPFTVKSQGFVAILGDMPEESRACWDFYSKGACRHCECRWEHSECMMPINFVVKEQ